ncbi:MAG: hypothetical protein RIS92_3057 [Verrucomicrobiota bacterium]|jgi:hypothetical protein
MKTTLSRCYFLRSSSALAALTLKVLPTGDAVARIVVRALTGEDCAAIGQLGSLTYRTRVDSG